MRKLYENFHIFHFQKRIVSAETIRGITVCVIKGVSILKACLDYSYHMQEVLNFGFLAEII